MPDPTPPSPLLLFGIMFVGVCGALALIFFFAFLTHVSRRIKQGGLQAVLPPRSLRSTRGYRSQNAVLSRSPQQNAESAKRSGVQAFKSGSGVQANTGDTVTIEPLPTTPDELHKLAHAITLYARRPNKQIAIETAWNCTKGDGEDWKGAVTLFDAAMGTAAMGVAKSRIGSEQAALSAVVVTS